MGLFFVCLIEARAKACDFPTPFFCYSATGIDKQCKRAVVDNYRLLLFSQLLEQHPTGWHRKSVARAKG